jgi:hypothetical protein
MFYNIGPRQGVQKETEWWKKINIKASFEMSNPFIFGKIKNLMQIKWKILEIGSTGTVFTKLFSSVLMNGQNKLEQGSLTKRGRLSKVDLLVLASLDQLLLILKILFTWFKTSYHNEEVNCTDSPPSVSFPGKPFQPCLWVRPEHIQMGSWA